MNLTLTITEQKNCGELRSGLYSMLSDCSEFMKEKMENYIPRILKLMDISFKEKDSYVSNLLRLKLSLEFVRITEYSSNYACVLGWRR